jgi:quercetin dioxygenase-like cupin family protein
MNKGDNVVNRSDRPYALGREEGQAVWFLNALLVVKASGEQTGGAFGLIDHLLPAGWASPYHVHRNEEESFYVVEGEMAFYVGDERVEAGPGAFVYGPREVPHGFAVEGDAPARVLLLNTPAGFEGFPVEAGEPARELTLPPPGAPDLERLAKIAATYDIQILGPLPGR